MLKVLTIMGTRPEAIKLAPVVLELQRHPDRFVSRVCVTAQHRDMLDQVLQLFGIVPDHDLDLMREAQRPGQVASAILARLEPILEAERPDWVLVQGDTTTTMAASIAAFYAGIKVGHVEAGLRSFNRHHPFPEEVNRRLTGVVADLHFAPTERARENLLREGIEPERIVVTGNTVIDALQWVSALPWKPEESPLATIPWEKRILLVTMHRRENFGEPIESVCRALRALADRYADSVQIVFPVHPNPRVREPVYRALEGHPAITLLPPLDYLSFVQLLKRSYLVLTDSGGLQEEAPSLGKPVLVLRETTERPEGAEAGMVRVVGTAYQTVLEAIVHVWKQDQDLTVAQAINFYGHGFAAVTIVATLKGPTIAGVIKLSS